MSWKIYALRAFLIVYVIIDVVLMTVIIGGPLIGDSTMAVEMLDYDGEVPLDLRAPILGGALAVLLGLFYLYCLIRLFLSLDRLMVNAHLGQLAGLGTAETLRILGKSLIWLWVAVIGVETFIPISLFWNAIEAYW